MNPIVVILISALTATAGIVVYDTVREDSAPQMGVSDIYEPEIEIDDSDDFEPEPALAGYGFEALMARVDKLERENDALQALLKSAGAKVGADGTLSAPSGEAFALPEVYEGDDLSDVDFNDKFLRSFRAALEKVETDRRQERVVDGLNRQLDRLGVELSSDQKESVIQSTMAFREKTRSLWRELPRGSDDESREARRVAFEEVREDFSTTIYNLVPSVEAEKIVDGMGRGIGFSSRRGGDRGGGGRGR